MPKTDPFGIWFGKMGFVATDQGGVQEAGNY